MRAEYPARRFLKTRNTRWAQAVAHRLAHAGVRPNFISIVGVVLAGLAGTCLLLTGKFGRDAQIVLFVAAAALIQLRLLCNMLDGMVALEGGLRTRAGEIFNDLPDRISDALILVGAGYSSPFFVWGAELGWAAALLAVLTAYVRLLGGAIGATQFFVGPMAKQHRMAVLTVACLVSAVEAALGASGRAMALALAVICIGCVVTLIRRTRLIVKALQSGQET